MAIGLADRIVAPPGRPGVQGIARSLDDVRLRGENLRAVLRDALTEGTLVRTIKRASSVKLDVLDPDRHLLRSPLLTEAHQLTLDGLAFIFAGVDYEGATEPLSLTYEPSAVHRLRGLNGPHKAFRQKMTRAEFALARVREAPPPTIPFICPELHTRQPVRNERAAREARQEALERRGKGLDGEVVLTVAGERADHAQLRVGDRALRVAESLKAPERVMEALMCALIVETHVGKLDSNALQVTPQTAAAGHFDPTHLELAVRGFLRGYTSSTQGAIEVFHAHPDYTPGEIAQAVQRSAYPDRYQERATEARRWVMAYGGGTISSTDYRQYQFEQKANETNWEVINRLAEEVHWACFESAGWVYFIAEPDLLGAVRRAVISDVSPGVVDTRFRYDVGRPTAEFTVEVDARAWEAPPGAVVEVTRHGPADGRYIVETMEAPLARRSSICEVTLKRPTEPLPEPAPPTTRISIGHAGGGPVDAPSKVARALVAMVAEIQATTGKFRYVWGGGHNPADISKQLSGYDCSGYISHILYAGGLLKTPLVSGALANIYQPGEGKWLTIYANAQHVFAKIWTPGGFRFFQAGGAANSTGWVPAGKQDSLAGYAARHPKGF